MLKKKKPKLVFSRQKLFLTLRDFAGSLVGVFIKNGFRTCSFNIVLKALTYLKFQYNYVPELVLTEFVDILSPTLKYRKKNVAGFINKIPVLLSLKESQSLILRWLYLAVKKGSSTNIALLLAKEFSHTLNFSSFSFFKLKEYYKDILSNLSLTKFLKRKKRRFKVKLFY